MKTYYIYPSKKGLLMRCYNNNTGEYEQEAYGSEVTDMLHRVVRRPVADVRGFKKNDKNSLLVEFPGFNIKVIDIDGLEKYESELEPLVNSLTTYVENKEISKYKEASKKQGPPKVSRENKHAHKHAIAALLTVCIMVTGTLSTIASVIKGDKGELPLVPKTSITELNPDFGEDELGGEHIATKPGISTPVTTPNSTTPTINDNIIETPDITPPIIVDYVNQYDTPKAENTRLLYGDLITKYSNMYGVDPELMIAIATQERGVHGEVMDDGGATGLMQIQNSVWIGSEISAYNFETEKYDKFTITNDMAKNLETNIQIGCMYFQNCLGYVNYNIPLAIQTYNFGIGNMRKVMDVYGAVAGKTRKEIAANPEDIGWLEYRTQIKVGDSLYLNHVLSWMGDSASITVQKKDGEIVEAHFANSSMTLDQAHHELVKVN